MAVYSTMAVIIVTHALHHTALLPSTVPMVVYDILCILSYFSLQHIIPTLDASAWEKVRPQ